MIDTLAIEGYRESVDDIRYATTLRLAIEKAQTGSKRALALEAKAYLDALDFSEDLDAVRTRIIDYIVRLTKVSF